MKLYSSSLPHSLSCVFTAGSLPSGDIRQLGRGRAKFSSEPKKSSRWSANNSNGSFQMFSSPAFPNSIFKSDKHTFTSSRIAVRSNLSEDMDDMLDDLIDKYGKVIFRRSDEKSATAEIDDDAESLSLAVAAAKIANEVKAADIKVLFVKPLVHWTRFFVIATAFSNPQIDAIGTKVRDMAEQHFGKVATGDSKPNSWTLLDFGDVVVHIFLPDQRAFYNLEDFYGNAPLIELPFEGEQRPQSSRGY